MYIHNQIFKKYMKTYIQKVPSDIENKGVKKLKIFITIDLLQKKHTLLHTDIIIL